ncbi:hypothetical protein ACFV6Z_01780 [Streptomyces sp. NPDC059818]|uniref:hypothetical protein n=1 Tax=Streptomyces sp. NPDC059818 TaxID=3346962 RepID=UPI003647FB92
MQMSTEETLRVTVAAIAHRTGEQQSVLAGALGLTQGQVSRRQRGIASWTLTDCDRLAAHWGMSVLDLLAGPTHALTKLPADRIPTGGQQTLVPLDIPTPAPTPERAPAVTPPSAPSEPAPAARPAPKRVAAPTGPLADRVRSRVAEKLAAHSGDLAAARAALIKSAVPVCVLTDAEVAPCLWPAVPQMH